MSKNKGTELDPVKVGLLGFGTAGSGTARVLARNAEEVERRADRRIQVTHASARRNRPKPFPGLERIELTTDAFKVVNNPEVEIIIELIGGETAARKLVLKAIENSKHIVTANKALIAQHGNEIFEAARTKGVIVAFEAAVATGIPIVKIMREGLSANRVEWVAGILTRHNPAPKVSKRNRASPEYNRFIAFQCLE